jgi:inositol hexakisphosphate/diphosphoinositol-pentakisphosphate kinase
MLQHDEWLCVVHVQESGIPVPHHIFVDRDGLPEGSDPPGFVETEDYVEVNGKP